MQIQSEEISPGDRIPLGGKSNFDFEPTSEMLSKPNESESYLNASYVNVRK